MAPGAIITEGQADYLEEQADPGAALLELEQMAPMRRQGLPRDVVEVVAFLLSERSAFINGQVIAVDGGASAWCLPTPPASELPVASQRGQS